MIFPFRYCCFTLIIQISLIEVNPGALKTSDCGTVEMKLLFSHLTAQKL